MNESEFYMKRALELAVGGWGRTNPNPLVGAVVVKEDRIIAEGFHKGLGCAHAEVDAFSNSLQDVKGGELYVNLEPCSHYGRTPPCAKAIIEAGIKKVVIAMEDPNPKVSGKGVEMLRGAGIEVVSGIMEEEAKKLNEIFIKFITRKRPFVIMKTAMTLDGKISSCNGDSKWISGESSRKYVHAIRDRAAAIMVGIHTVITDDPSLTTRVDSGTGKDPVKIIVDAKGGIPLDSKVVRAACQSRVIVATTSSINENKENELKNRGVEIIKADGSDNKVDLGKLMDFLYSNEIDSVLLEGGGGLNASALEYRIVDKVMSFIAPKIIGGKDARTPVEGLGIPLMADAVKLGNITVERYDEDVLIEGYIK